MGANKREPAPRSSAESPGKAPKVLKATVVEDMSTAVVPVGRPAVRDDSTPSPPSWQPVAAHDEMSASTYKQMQIIIPFVLAHLPARVGINTALADVKPLEIRSGSDDACGYKETWDPARCTTSLSQNNVYEAGGNLFWLDTQLATAGIESDILHRQEPGWLTIMDLAQQLFSKTAMDGLVSSRDTVATPRRLLFPVVLDAWAADASTLSAGRLPCKVNLASGHALVWSWYYAMAVSFHEGDELMIRALYNCALSTTIRVRVLSAEHDIVLLAIRSSETAVGAEKGLSDTFLGWSEKILSIVDSKLSSAKIAAHLDRQGVTYGGSKVSKQMVLSAQAIVSVMSPAGRSALLAIDRAFGPSVVSTSYAKLQTVVRLAKAGTSAEEACDLAAFAFGMMFLSFYRREVPVKFFRADVIEKNKHDGSPGWFHMSAAKRLMIKHLIHCTRCLDAGDGTDEASKKIADAFGDPLSFHATFCLAMHRVQDDGDAEMPESVTNTVAAFAEGMPKLLVGAAEMLHDMYCGHFDRDFKTLAAEADMPKAVYACFEDTGPTHDLGQRLRKWMRSTTTSTTVVSTCDHGAVPGLSIRQLARLGSDPGGVSPEERRDAIERERNDLWRKAQSQRQRFVQFALLKTHSAGAIAELVKKAGSIMAPKYQLNEAHRAFICSMDLLQEADSQPWTRPHNPSGSCVDAIVAYLTAVDGPADFCFAFDGRSRTARRRLEDAFGKCKYSQEMWLVYQLPETSSSRRVVFASQSREAAQVRLPCPRVRLNTKQREAFVASGEQSTHDTTWTAVPACPVGRLPRMSIAAKKEIFHGIDVQAAAPPKWKYDGVPYMWNEVKSAHFWEVFLVSHDIGAVVDLSPGSGQLATAAMNLGLQYVGITTHSSHLSWLANTVDRSAVRMIAENGSALYQQELAEHLRKQFAEVMGEGHEADVEEGAAEEEDDDADLFFDDQTV